MMLEVYHRKGMFSFRESLTRILKKLGVESRLQALLFALRQRVVEVRS